MSLCNDVDAKFTLCNCHWALPVHKGFDDHDFVSETQLRDARKVQFPSSFSVKFWYHWVLSVWWLHNSTYRDWHRHVTLVTTTRCLPPWFSRHCNVGLWAGPWVGDMWNVIIDRKFWPFSVSSVHGSSRHHQSETWELCFVNKCHCMCECCSFKKQIYVFLTKEV